MRGFPVSGFSDLTDRENGRAKRTRGFWNGGSFPVSYTHLDVYKRQAMDGDGVVTVNIAKAEMGQHVGTALARILADELEVEWSKIRIIHVDTDPKWGVMVTGGSWSVSQLSLIHI